MEVGFIGLGMMGSAMARNIVKAGHRVRVWNRSPVASDAVPDAVVVPAPAEVLQADVAFTMLSDDAAIREVVLGSGVLGGARPGLVHVVTSTISIAFADELSVAHKQAGIAYLSAPVFGRPDVAAAAQLNIMAAGDPAALDRVQPLLDVIGKKTWRLGDDPKVANAAKIAGNMMIAMAIEAMGEAVALTGAQGLPPEPLFELLLSTLFGGRAYENYSGKIVSGDIEPGFKMSLGLKDLRLAAEAADGAGLRLPMLDAVRARMTDAVEAGLGDKDWSAVAGFDFRRLG